MKPLEPGPPTPHGLLEAIHIAAAAEVPPMKIASPDILLNAVNITLADPTAPKAQELLGILKTSAAEQARMLHLALTQETLNAAVDKLPASSISKAQTPAIALQRLASQVRQKFNLFKTGAQKPIETRKADSLCPLDELGLLFLERLRVRPIGQTVERAPFYELSVEPGETISLSHDSFAQRDLSQEDIFTEEQTKESSLTSVLSTSLTSEYTSEHTKATNWKISPSTSAEAKVPIYGVPVDFKAGVSGEYGSDVTDKSTSKESAAHSQTLTEVASSKLFRSHKTTVKISKTETDTTKNARTFTNTSGQVKKIYMRKMVRVHHLSYERYGVRMVWSPCIEDPGRDIRDLIPGMAAFPKEIKAIRDKWNAAPPPSELGSPPANQTVCTGWSGQQSGGLWGKSYDDSLSLQIPSGYVFGDANIDKSDENHNPGVSISSRPPSGATGVVNFVVHIGLNGGLSPDKVNYRLCVLAAPGPDLMAQWNAKVQNWRDEQAQKEILAFLADKKDEIKNLDVNAWPPSELMRRAISELFGDPAGYHSCEIVEMLHRVFEWENLTYRLFAPWWNPNAKVDGLQSLSTTFLNASWAKLYIPMRPGYEEDAIAFLASVGAIAQQPALLNDIEYYLNDMRQNVEPLFTRAYVPGATDPAEIDGPCDILLTTLGDDVWAHSYESKLKFQVLDRWVVTTPTDGVDYEEAYVRCPLPNPNDPQTAQLAVNTVPPNLDVRIGTAGPFSAAPVTKQVVAKETQTIAATDPQMKDGVGYQFTAWSTGAASASTTIQPAANVTAIASFRVASYLVNATVSGAGGTVALNPAAGGVAGFPSNWYAPGSQVRILASANLGFGLKDVQILIGAKAQTVTTANTPVTVDGPVTATVTFVPRPATISTIFPPIAAAAGGGAATPGAFQSKVSFSNPTPTPGLDLRVTAVTFTTTGGTGTVTLSSALPVVFGDIPANGQSSTQQLSYQIPAGVTTFDMFVTVQVKNSSGDVFTNQVSAGLTKP